MKSYFLKDVVVVENFRRLFLCRFLVDFKCPAPYHSVSKELLLINRCCLKNWKGRHNIFNVLLVYNTVYHTMRLLSRQTPLQRYR